MKVKISINNSGGELDSTVVDANDDQDDKAIGWAVRRLVKMQRWHVGDSLVIEEVQDATR